MLVINVSSGGALIDTPVRMVPDSKVDLRLPGREGTVSIRGRVVRCYVSSLRAEYIRYQAALAFECPTAWPLVSPSRG